jgi:hypothetical protein
MRVMRRIMREMGRMRVRMGEEKSDEAVDSDTQTTNAEGAEKESGRGRCYGDEVGDDDVDSNMARSDILISSPISNEENEVYSLLDVLQGEQNFKKLTC